MEFIRKIKKGKWTGYSIYKSKNGDLWVTDKYGRWIKKI